MATTFEARPSANRKVPVRTTKVTSVYARNIVLFTRSPLNGHLSTFELRNTSSSREINRSNKAQIIAPMRIRSLERLHVLHLAGMATAAFPFRDLGVVRTLTARELSPLSG